MTAIRIRASDQLNGTLDTFNGIATSIVAQQVSGNQWIANGQTRNPADLFRHVLQGPANARPVPDSQIDLTALVQWANYCASNGFWFDQVVSTPRSVPDMLADVCAAGRAVPVFKDGKWSVIWDQAVIPIVQQFTPRNSWGFEAVREYVQLPHAFRVRFINRDRGFVEDERIVYNDGYSASNATLFEGIEFPGVTDAHSIWRHGRFHMAQLKLRPETITLNTDWENLVCTRGDRVRVQHDVMLIGQTSGRITKFENGELHLDEQLIVEDGKSYMLRWRTAEFGFISQVVQGLPAGEYRKLPWAYVNTPSVGDLFSFGEANRETAVYRVLSVEPNADLTARLTLVDDAPEISLADQGTIPPFQSNISQPPDPFLLPPTDLELNQEAYQQGDTWLARIYLDWNIPRSGRVSAFEVSYMDQEIGTWKTLGRTPATQTNYTVNGLDDGIYAFRVRSIFNDSTFSSWLRSEDISTTSLLEPPANVQNFNIATIGDISTLSWNAVSNAAYYEIKFASADILEPIWNVATPLIPKTATTSIQVPTMIGTYLIKAVRGNGIRSRQSTGITTNVAALNGLNVVEVLNETGFNGTLDRLEIVNGSLQLLSKNVIANWSTLADVISCLLYTSPSPRDQRGSRMPSSA